MRDCISIKLIDQMSPFPEAGLSMQAAHKIASLKTNSLQTSGDTQVDVVTDHAGKSIVIISTVIIGITHVGDQRLRCPLLIAPQQRLNQGFMMLFRYSITILAVFMKVIEMRANSQSQSVLMMSIRTGDLDCSYSRK